MTTALPRDPIDTRTNVVRIDDLRAPQRTPAQQAAWQYGLDLKVALAPQDILREAMERTGLSNFGDATLADRLAAQCRAVDADTGLSGIGRMSIRQRLLGLLAARLRFEDYVRRHPEALEVRLDPPVIVAGLPRSGTTHLVNLLAADSRFRSLPWWECLEPTPFPGDGPGRDGVDPRFQRCLAAYEIQRKSAPVLAAMHDRHPSVIEEDCELVDLDLCSYTLEWYARVPQWREHYLALDQDAHYAFLRKELQVLSHLRGPQRWVLKTPQHLEQLGPLLRTFPDATVALTLRDPVAVLQSAITMLGWGERMRRLTVDLDGLASYWLDRIERLLRAKLRDLHLIPAAKRIDVGFSQFMADEFGTVTRILDAAGVGVPEETRRQLTTYIDGNPRGKNGRMIYDLRGDFGLDPDEIRKRFAFYFDVFPQIRPEVH